MPLMSFPVLRVVQAIVLFSTVTFARAEPSLLLVPIDTTWRYNQNAQALADNWASAAFDDSSWPSGQALLGYDVHQYPEPVRTTLNRFLPGTTDGITTYYFRTSFDFATNTAGAWLQLGLLADDGAVIYLNGAEILRRRVPVGQTHLTTATNQTHESYYEVVLMPASSLVTGRNIVAAEVHQRSPGTSDMMFGLTAWAVWPEPLQLLEGPTISGTQSNSETRISVRVFGSAPVYQWFRNGVAVPGANAAEHVISPTTPSHQGDYHMVVTNFLGSLQSDSVNLTLTPDQTPPELISGAAIDFQRAIRLTWSEFVDRATGTNRANYSVTYLGSTNPLVITDVGVSGPLTLLRGISPWDPQRDFVVAVNGVRDGASNAVAPNSRIWIPRRTPASTFVKRDAVWRHHRDPIFGDLSHDWRTAAFDDSSWATIRAPVASTNAVSSQPVNTRVDFVSPTWYFRTSFIVPQSGRFARLTSNVAINNGAVYYLNGKEILRLNMPSGPVYFGTFAASDSGTSSGPISLTVSNLIRGTNVLAVSVHQSDRPVYSTFPRQDFVFATDLAGFIITTNIPPVLFATRQAGQVVLTWTEDGYTLETAAGLDRDWTEIPSSGRTYTTDHNDLRRFYRLRESR